MSEEEVRADDGPPAPLPLPPRLADASAASVECKNDPFLIVCRCFGVIAAAVALLCVAVNAISAIHSFTRAENLLDGIFDGILRCFAVVIALFVAISETEWERILKFWMILEYWPGRGMLQIFVAVMTKSLSNGTSVSKWMVVIQEVASYMMLACGIIYIIAGLLCLGRLKQSRQRKSLTQSKVQTEYEDQENRRKELEEGLLPG